MPARPASPAASTIRFGDGPSPRAIAGATGAMTSSTNARMRPARTERSISVDTDERCLALRDAAADPCCAISAAATAQLVEECHENSRSAGADRMADRNRSAVDVDPARVDLEHPSARDGDCRKGFVDLHQVELSSIETVRLRERGFDGERRYCREIRMLSGGFPVREPGAERRQPFGAGTLCAHEEDRRGAVIHPGRVARSDRGAVTERTTQRGELLDRRVRAWLLVTADS